MAFLEGWRFLSSARFKMIIQTLAGKLDITAPLLWLGRVPVVNAFDDEIVGRFTGKIFAADVIADDAEAVTYESGKLELVTNLIPNLKVGTRMSQNMINRMNRMRNGALLPGDNNAMELFMNRTAENLLQGVRERMNQLIVAMLLDNLNYDRLGIKIQNASWGTPSVLKVVPAQAWSTDGVTVNASATPITDILQLTNEVAADTYGIRYDRVTMSSKAFRFLVGSAEFAAKAKVILGFDFSTTTAPTPISTHDQPVMQSMLGRILNMDVETYDGAYWQRQPNGTAVRTKVLPVNQVLLTMKSNDGDGTVYDFANGVVTESIVASMTGNGPAGVSGEEYGPIGYYTSKEDLNPPDVTAWAVARGWPRRHVPEAAASLTVGTWTS